MQYKIIESLKSINANDWNKVVGSQYPFSHYEFLRALEDHEAVGEKYGWWPRFVTAWEGETLTGAVPLYLKDNSYGEFVFDMAWADAYQRAGIRYYPKYVASIPYTPATGPRIHVIDNHPHASEIRSGLIKATQQLAEESGVSSLHWLFTDEKDTVTLKEQGYTLRLGCQFHWQNENYQSFDDYLQTFSAAKRKKVKRKRRRVVEQDIEIEIIHGNEMSDEQ